MRIEKVVIENLNSLMGRFEIDLTDRAYTGGLFAIVGPSGAGKTTVLDAICLALYGKTPRIDSVSNEHDEVMNKGAASCRAEVIFTARGKRYKSIFVHERARGAKPFRAVKRELLVQDADGAWNVAAARIREVGERIEEICGLDYGRFTRSIMLAQFRFAEFLQANSNERAEILEQITDIDIYRRISIAVYERTQRQKQRLNETRTRIGDIAILSEDEETARKEEVKKLETVVAAHGMLRDELGRCRTMAQQLKSLTVELEGYKKAEQPLAEELKKQTSALKATEKDEIKKKAELDALSETLKVVRELDIKASHKMDEIKRITQEVSAADAKVHEHKQAVLQIFKKYEPDAASERYKALYDTGDVSAELRGKARAELDAAKAQSEVIEAQIAQTLAKKDEAHWRSRLEKLRKKLPIVEAAEALNKAREQLAGYEKQKAAQEKEQQASEQAAKGIEEQYEYARLNKRFGEERRRLEDGKPCPLCGALHHPAVDQTFDEVYYESARQKYDQMQQKRDGFKNALRQIELRTADLNVLIDEKTRYIEQNKAVMAEHDGEQNQESIVNTIDDIEQRLREYSVLKSKKIVAAENIVGMTARFGDVDKDVELIDSHKRMIAEAQKEFERLRRLREQAQAEHDTLNAQRKDLFGDKDANAGEAAAKKSLFIAQTKKEQSRKQAEQAARAVEQNSKDISRILSDVKMRSQQFKVAFEKTKEDAVKAENVSDDIDVTALYERYIDETSSIEESHDTSTLERVQVALTALITGETARLGSVQQILKTNAERRQEIKTLKTQEKAYRQALDKWEKLNGLIGSASGNKFSRMAQSITFDTLLRFANNSLKRMSDRYILMRSEAGPDKPLELAVIDTYQAGERRPVSNLSGGESFIVSMALALGLSEMSSGAARIDSLFIDEGFASLDEDYLEAALQTLATLGNREGKLIGVISHVEELKSRIDVQIEVRRRSGGRSELSGPGVMSILN